MVEPSKQVGEGSRSPETPRSAETGSGSSSIPAMGDLVLDHYQSVYRYAYRLSGRAEDAEDLSQQTFLLAHRKLRQLREPEKAIRWLFAILRSCYFKSGRKRRPIAAVNLELDVDAVPDGGLRAARDGDIDEERLQQAIDELPDEFKVVLLMFYFEEFSYKEIAARLDIKIGTVMSRLSRAKSRLRIRLAETEADPTAAGQRGSKSPLRASTTDLTRG
ncbi:MAG: RNA polymerase sigma factor [Pirellulaceae bacterium]